MNVSNYVFLYNDIYIYNMHIVMLCIILYKCFPDKLKLFLKWNENLVLFTSIIYCIFVGCFIQYLWIPNIIMQIDNKLVDKHVILDG